MLMQIWDYKIPLKFMGLCRRNEILTLKIPLKFVELFAKHASLVKLWDYVANMQVWLTQYSKYSTNSNMKFSRKWISIFSILIQQLIYIFNFKWI